MAKKKPYENSEDLLKTSASLQRLLVDADDLLQVLDGLVEELSRPPVDPEEHETVIISRITRLTGRVYTNLEKMKSERATAAQAAQKDPQVEMAFAADLTMIENALERFGLAWPVDPDDSAKLLVPAEEAVTRLRASTEELAKVRKVAAMESTPSMLREHLKQLRWGYALDFHEAFETQLKSGRRSQRGLALSRQPPAAGRRHRTARPRVDLPRCITDLVAGRQPDFPVRAGHHVDPRGPVGGPFGWSTSLAIRFQNANPRNCSPSTSWPWWAVAYTC